MAILSFGALRLFSWLFSQRPGALKHIQFVIYESVYFLKFLLLPALQLSHKGDEMFPLIIPGLKTVLLIGSVFFLHFLNKQQLFHFRALL